MFEVGQMVRRTYGNSEGMEIGDVGRVKTIIDSEWVELEEYGGRHLIDRLELIEDEKFINEYIINHLDKKISNLVKEDPERRIRRLEGDIQDLKYTIERHRKYMNAEWTEYKQAMDKIEFYKNKEIKTFKDDIESLLNHKYVENILVKGSELVITTKYIDIFDEKGNKFKGNKYELVFKFSEMTCYIYGLDEDYCRQSYWTSHDPHPHVNGEIGEACWGSAGSMLTENMNEHEIYASFIIVLNFLQQVNTEDAAGKYIRNWDCVDEDDDIIDNPYEIEMKECTVCEEELEEVPVFTLTDEESGESQDFELLASATIDDVLYYALVPVDEEAEEYVILSVEEDGDDIVLSSIDDDDVFEKVEEYFNDLFFSEVDYDA